MTRFARGVAERAESLTPARPTERTTHFRIARSRKHELTLLVPPHAVLKVWTHPVVDSDFLRDAALLANHLRAPTMVPELEGNGLLSAWVEGEPLSDLSVEERVFHVRRILAGLAGAVAASITPDDEDFLLAVATKGDPVVTASSLFRELLGCEEVSTLRRAPLALQHGDISPTNVIIGPDDEAVVIDWSPELVGLRPFWTDAVQITAAAGEGLLDAGTFEADLRLVWEAADFPAPRTRTVSQVAARAFELGLYLSGWQRDQSGGIAARRVGKRADFLPKPHKVREAVERLRRFP